MEGGGRRAALVVRRRSRRGKLPSSGAGRAGVSSRRPAQVAPAEFCCAEEFARPLRGPRGAAVRRPPWIPRAPEAPPLDSVRGAGLYRKISLACLRQTIEGSHGPISTAGSKNLRPHERLLTRLPAGRARSRGKGWAKCTHFRNRQARGRINHPCQTAWHTRVFSK